MLFVYGSFRPRKDFQLEIKCSYTKLVPLSELKPFSRNRNSHSEEQIERLGKLLSHHGQRRPIIVSTLSGEIVAGNGTFLAMQKIGTAEAAVDFQDFENSDAEYTFSVSDNAISEWSEIDLAGINADLADLGPFDLDLLGIKDFVVDVSELEPQCDEDEIPKKVEPKTKRGDIYKLGNHRLMCGDSTMIDDVEKLIDIDKVTMCFTSPPYNLGDNAKLRGYNGDGKDSAYLEKSDHKSQTDYLQFLNDFTSICVSKCEISFINIQLLAGNKLIMPEYWNNFKDRLVDLMIWDKEHAQPSAAQRVLNSVFEMIYIFSNEENPKRSIKTGPDFRGTIQNIFRLNPLRGKKDESAKDHGAVFPLSFPSYFIESFTNKNDTVYDSFTGTGTTMIACEKLGRSFYGMELEPHYCDVIVARWEKYTGKKAELINAGNSQ